MRYTAYRGLKRGSMWVRLKYAAMNLKKLAMWGWKALHLELISRDNLFQSETAQKGGLRHLYC